MNHRNLLYPILLALFACLSEAGYARSIARETVADSVSLRMVGPQGPGCDHTYAIVLGDSIGVTHFSTDTRDTKEYYNYTGTQSHEVYYTFILSRPMVIVADHLRSEMIYSDLILEKYGPLEGRPGGWGVNEIGWFFHSDDFFESEAVWKPYEKLLPVDSVRNSPGLACFCKRLEPGLYYLISEGHGMNAANDGWITTNFRAFGIPGDAFEYPLELGTRSTAFERTDTLRAADYYDVCDAREGPDAVYRVSLEVPLRLNLSTTLLSGDASQVPAGVYLYDEQRSLLASGQGTLDNCVLPAGTSYFAVEMREGQQVRVDIRMNNDAYKGDTMDNPFDLGCFSDSFVREDSFDTAAFTDAYDPDYGTRDVFHRFEIRVPVSLRVDHFSQLDGTRLWLLDSEGHDLERAEIPPADDSGACNELFVNRLESGVYYLVSEGLYADGPISLRVEGEYRPGYVPDPELRPDERKNYILTVEPRRAFFGNGSLTVENASFSLDYFDGLGRPQQQLRHGVTPDKHDVAVLQEYDALGRESDLWLPVVRAGSGNFIPREQVAGLAATLYGDTHAFVSPVYDSSPFSRVTASYGAGDEWRAADRAVHTQWRLNTAEGPAACRHFGVGGTLADPVLADRGMYPAGSLFLTVTTDEDGRCVHTFTDSQGRQVLVRRISDDGFADTYYVYDLRGNLCFVLPPELLAGTLSDTRLADYAYCYRYDARNRCIGKRLPGCGWAEYYYDLNDRLVYSQDAAQAVRNEWTFSLSDIFNRPALTAVIHAQPTRTRVERGAYFVVRDTNSSYGYTQSAGRKLDESDLLQVNYYDDYSFLTPGELDYEPDGNFGRRWDNARDLLTGTRTTVLGQDAFVLSATYYDYKQRPVQTRAELPGGGLRVGKFRVDFSGQVLEALESVRPSATAAADILATRNRYDHAGRLTASETVLDGGDTAVVNYVYDPLGRLSQSIQGRGEHRIATTHSYNVRGWLTAKNNDFFGMTLAYVNPGLPGIAPSYSGNITAWNWTHGPASAGNAYGFAYDGLSRLADTRQFSGNTATDLFVERNLTYDANGNIRTLKRYADGALGHDFTYAYTGNRLTTLTGGGTASTYAYDANGNMTHDGMNNLDLTYNRLNLIEKVEGEGGISANYSYLSDGTKFSALTADGSGLVYAGSLVYRKQGDVLTLESAGFGGGRLVASRTSAGTHYTPQYHLTDHLGSVRAVLDSDGNVVERSDYYPFGLRWVDSQQPISDNRYRYNGKEEQHFLNVPYTDYGARQYDASTITWHGVDPLLEKYFPMSPYAFCINNPINFLDLNGCEISFEGLSISTIILILLDLRDFTGIDLSYHNNMLVYNNDESGNPKSIKNQFSTTARKMLIDAIDNEEKVLVTTSYNGSNAFNEEKGPEAGMTIGIDSRAIMNHVKGTSSDLDSRTMGYGMTFLHELGHTKIGGDRRDYYNNANEIFDFGATGPNVDFMNQIRRELGPKFGERLSYGYLTDAPYLPFGVISFNEIINSINPSRAFIRVR